MSAHFSLSDIDTDTPITKKEKMATGSSRARIPNLRSKSAAKKRKTDDVIDLSDPPFEFDKAIEQLSRCHHEKLEIIEDMQRLAQTRIAAAEKDAAELAKMKKEIKELKASIVKKSAEAEAKILQEKNVLLAEIKRDATIAVLEARILMASEAASKGFDASIWNVQAWKDKLAGLKGEDPDVESAPMEVGGKAPKAAASKDGGKEDVVMEEQDPVAGARKDVEVEGAGGTIPGEEGV